MVVMAGRPLETEKRKRLKTRGKELKRGILWGGQADKKRNPKAGRQPLAKKNGKRFSRVSVFWEIRNADIQA